MYLFSYISFPLLILGCFSFSIDSPLPGVLLESSSPLLLVLFGSVPLVSPGSSHLLTLAFFQVYSWCPRLLPIADIPRLRPLDSLPSESLLLLTVLVTEDSVSSVLLLSPPVSYSMSDTETWMSIGISIPLGLIYGDLFKSVLWLL